MNYFAIPRLMAAAVLSLASGAALAQYIWIDEKGGKNVSDRPPPPSVPAKNILKAPNGTLPPASAAPAATEAAVTSLADREADYRKRTAENAAADKKQAELAKHQADTRKACDAARQYKAQLDTGMRMMEVAPDGSRSVLTEERRVRNMAKVRQVLDKCK